MTKNKPGKCRSVTEVVKLEDGLEVLVEVRVTPLDDGGT